MQVTNLIRSRFRFAGDLARAAEVAAVLAKYGLAGWLTEVEWAPIHNAMKSHGGQVLGDVTFEARARLALTDLGATFIKLGQMLSTRPGLVGEEMAAELSKLQDHIEPDPPEVAIRMVETELGRPIAECFKEFNGVALASASIGQVHRAKLKSGRLAAVKVEHPDIEGTVRRDLDVLGFLADIAQNNDQIRRYQPVEIVREFSRNMLREMDFNRELRSLQIFRRNFAEDETVVFPKPYPDFSTGRVLTMELLKGVPISDTAHLDKLDLDRAELARNGANVYVEMIFRDGFYHADPHPGNILIMPDGKIGVLDAGMVGRVDEVFKRHIEDILLAAGDRDAERLTEAVIRICGEPVGLDRSVLSTDLTELFEEYGTQSVGQFNVGGALTSVRNILAEHKLNMPGKLSMLLKCLILLESTGRLLSPDFSLAELLAPWRDKYVHHRFSFAARRKEFRQLYTDWERIAENVPKTVTKLMEKVEHGKFTIHLEHQHLKSAANRLVVGLFVSSWVIASALLIEHSVPPLIWGLSLLGLPGFAVGVLFGLRMLWVNRDRIVSRREGDWD